MKESRIVLGARAAHAENLNNMFHVALSDVMLGNNTMVGRFTHDGIHVLAYLVGALRMDGGTLLVKQTCKGQSASYTVYNLEREHAELYRRLGQSDYVREMYNICGNALIVRNRMIESSKVNAKG